MKYDFNKIVDRTNTGCFKWDYNKEKFGTDDLIPLWVADMDFKSPDFIINALKSRVEHGVFGYTFYPQAFFSSLQNWLVKRFFWKIETKWILPVPRLESALNFAVQAFTKENDKVLIQTPIYTPFFSAIENNNRKCVISKLMNIDGHYEIDFADLEKKISSGVKMMILCSPHNPVGRVWTIEELTHIGNLCLENNVILISDEIHADFVFKGNKHYPIAAISPDFEDISVSMYAPTKTFNLAGLTTSALVIPNPVLYKKYQEKLKNSAIGLGNIFGIEAFINAYEYGEDWLEQLLQYLENNYQYICDFLKEKIPEIIPTKMEGTYLLWLDCRNLNLSQDELNKFMIFKARLGLNDGVQYGKDGAGYMRLNFGTSKNILRNALLQLENEVISLRAKNG